MTVELELMRDTTTHGLMFARPLPQGSAPPKPDAFWTDAYGWLVPDTRLRALEDAWEKVQGFDRANLIRIRGAIPELAALLDSPIGEDNDESHRPPNSLPNRGNMSWVAEQLGKYNDTDQSVVPNLSIVTVVGAYADGTLMTKDEWDTLTKENPK